MRIRFPFLAAAAIVLASFRPPEAQPSPLPDRAVLLLASMEKNIPGLGESVEILAAAGALPPDAEGALEALAAHPALHASLPLLIQRDILQENLDARRIRIRVDGRDDEWKAVPESVTDPGGDSYEGRADMDVVSAAAFVDERGGLDLRLRTQAPPAADPYYDFLIDVPGEGADWDFQLILWMEAGTAFAALNDLVAGKPVPDAGIESARGAGIEVRVPLSSLAPSRAADSLRILARSFDRKAVTVDAAPLLQPMVSLENHCLALLLDLLARDPSAAEDDISTALALANGWLYSAAGPPTRNRIKADMADHLALYHRIVSWQAERGLPYRLDRVPLLAKVVWADREGTSFRLIQEAMGLRGTPGLLTLPVYEEFVDKPADLAFLHALVVAEGLGAGTLREAAAALEDFVHGKRVYRSSMENLEDFNRRGMFSDADLAAARAEYASGGYETPWFGKLRRWDDFRWLGWQVALFRSQGMFRGDCGDTTVVQMGFYRALGVAPLSFQWAHPEGIAAFSHNFPGYYDPAFGRWFSVQKPFFYGDGGVPLEGIPVFFHYTKPFWHPWLADMDLEVTVAGKTTTVRSPHYQGELTSSDRLKVFLTRGMEEDRFLEVFLSGRTQEAGLFFTDRTAPESLADRDGDGLEDGLEAEMGTDAGDPDSDGDGFSDAWELSRGFLPADARSHGPEADPAVDGLLRAAERAGASMALDPVGDAVQPGPGDARALLCRADGKALYAAVEFEGGLPDAGRATHCFLVTPNRAGADEYWVWFQDGKSGASRSGRGRDAWKTMPARPGNSTCSIAVTEFSIPLSYADGASSVFVRYFLDTSRDGSPKSARTDWTPSVRVAVAGPDPSALRASLASAATLAADAEGDAQSIPFPSDIRGLRCAADAAGLVCSVEYRDPAAELPFGICAFEIREKESGKGWWIQWNDLNGPSVWRMKPDGSLETSSFDRTGYDALPAGNGFVFLIPRAQFTPDSTLYLRFHAGGAPDGMPATMSDAVGRVRIPPPGPDPAADLLREAGAARLDDPAGDAKPLAPRFDIRTVRARVSDGMLALRVDYHEAGWERGFGFHSIHLRSAKDGENLWIQWWDLGGFGVWTWKDGAAAAEAPVDNAAFDCVPMGDAMGFAVPVGLLFAGRPGGLPEELEIAYYAGGTATDGRTDAQGDAAGILTLRTR